MTTATKIADDSGAAKIAAVIARAVRRTKSQAAARKALKAVPAAPAWRPTGPVLNSLVVDGRLAVSVALCGRHGQGRCMVLEEIDWKRVKLVLGERWNVGRTGGFEYVTGYSGKAGLAAGNSKGLILARWLTHAEPGEVVLYRDGDAMNLVRANLVVVSRREALEAMRS